MNVNDMGVQELRLAVQELRRYPAEVSRLEELVAALENELGAATAIVDHNPKTKDGVPIVLGVTRVYYPGDAITGRDPLTGIPYMVTLGIDCKSWPSVRVAWDDGDGSRIRGDMMVAALELYSTREAAGEPVDIAPPGKHVVVSGNEHRGITKRKARKGDAT